MDVTELPSINEVSEVPENESMYLTEFGIDSVPVRVVMSWKPKCPSTVKEDPRIREVIIVF